MTTYAQRWPAPSTSQETETILADARQIVPTLTEDDLESACCQLAALAGSFNHNIGYEQRYQMINILAQVGNDAIEPVLCVLVDTPREEQFDITKQFIRRLVAIAEET